MFSWREAVLVFSLPLEGIGCHTMCEKEEK